MFLERFIRFKQSKIAAVVRVSAYFACVGLAVATITTQKAKADLTEQGFVLGRDLAKIAELIDHTYEVRMNGETIYMATTESRLSKKEILDRYDEVCRTNPGLIAEEWQKVPQAQDPNRATDGTLLTRLGIIRKDTGNEGMVACLAKPDKESAGINDAFSKFVRTGDLGYVGKLRYVYVTGPSASGTYEVTTLWTESSFNLNNFWGAGGDGGDAPGTDSPTAGRPPNAKRFLSAEIVGTPYAVRLYDSEATPEKVYEKYDSTMFNDDWLVFNQYGEGAHVYFKDGVETIVSAVRDNDGKTVISVGEFGGDRLAAAQ